MSPLPLSPSEKQETTTPLDLSCKTSSAEIEKGEDRRRALQVGGTALLVLTFQTLGIIYSDIASGPLPSEEDVLGGISAIVWSLTLVPLLKYVGFALSFGTGEGEGGTDDEDRSLTHDSSYKFKYDTPGASSASSTARLGKNSRLKWYLLPWTLFGTALCIADGVFTPAVSVTSAVGGIAIAKPYVSSKIIPISIAFLIGLFLVQRFGTARIGKVFAPVTLMWLLLLGGTGIVNIIHHPAIFRAFDPSRAVLLFVRTGQYDILAGVLLAVTGCEAMFANLGQFNKASIRVKALVSLSIEKLSSPTFSTRPYQVRPVDPLLDHVHLRNFGHSDCVSSDDHSCIQFDAAADKSEKFPPLLMKYTSETVQGQVYVPAVNWSIGLGCIVVVAAFKDLAALTNAYGFAVATVMIVTTSLLAIQIRYVKRLPAILGFAFFLFLASSMARLFWGASLRKVPHGAWVPLMIGSVLMIIMWFWTWAKGLEDEFDGANRRNLRHFIMLDTIDPGTKTPVPNMATIPVHPSQSINQEITFTDDQLATEEDLENEKLGLFLLSDNKERRPLPRVETAAVFHKLSAGKGVPHAFYAFLRQWPALPRVVIFLSVRVMPTARVAPEDRYIVSRVRSLPGFFGVTYFKGFRDDFQVMIDDIIEKLYDLERRAAGEDAAKQLREASKVTTHIVPSYYVVSKPVEMGFLSPILDWVRAMLVEGFYRRMSTMFPETANWLGSADEIIRVGVNAVI
ncbi:high affinity potassium transporter [Ceratobasidium sp. AG-Ba]|nr:high affinity potassium transporter [Ceratobasidium sp. AG-Ba]